MGLDMNRKLTLKQEFFCTAFVETRNGSEAYRQSYNAINMKEASINVQACKMLKSPKITLRIEELLESHAERHEVTIDSLTTEYLNAITMAKTAKNPGVIISGTTALGKLHGLIIEKQRVDIPQLDTEYTLELVRPPETQVQ
jgi:phage terminase small subunit